MSRRICKESEAACLAPAGYQVGGLGGSVGEGDGSCKGTCFACGEAVCANCSTVVAWYQHGRQRICYGCQVERVKTDKVAHERLEKRIRARLHRLVNAPKRK